VYRILHRIAKMDGAIYIGTAGWNIRKDYVPLFPGQGSHLERYAQSFNAVEINSSFYKEHNPVTYARWAAAVPPEFRFSVKLSRYFTHEKKLAETGERLRSTLLAVAELGPKFGVLLVQLPPSLKFEARTAEKFFGDLRALYEGPLAIEPRHLTWTDERALNLLERERICKVLADPEPCPLSQPFVSDLIYYRLHGSPEIYRSNYECERLNKIESEMRNAAQTAAVSQTWCIFDNTTFGYATVNAYDLDRRLRVPPQ
jgi:uncharacterized protein YecE (DUF72 family)